MMKNKNNIRYYIAYGSNMNLEQMSQRCPTAEVVGISEVNGYKLLFRGSSHAVATIEPMEKSSVPVVVWSIKPRDEQALDRYEGYPYLYRKEMVTVKLKRSEIQAMIYIMNEGRPLGTPNIIYYSTIREGYASAGFDVEILNKAVRNSKIGNRQK